MDSTGFLALWDAGDEHYAQAARLQAELVAKHRRFLTSEYVVDENGDAVVGPPQSCRRCGFFRHDRA
jgi:hypothetical protein